MKINDLKASTTLATTGDGFEGYSDHVEGEDSPQQDGLIRGSRLKFGNTAEWETRDGGVTKDDRRRDQAGGGQVGCGRGQ
jgi:hypothetical protein